MVFHKISSYCISCLLWCFIRYLHIVYLVIYGVLGFIRYLHIVYLVIMVFHNISSIVYHGVCISCYYGVL